MKVALITRSTLYKVPGGDTEQVIQTAKCLKEIGMETEICLTNEQINYGDYDLLHFFNIIRPSDILFHARRANKPFVISPNLIDYSEYDRRQRTGISGLIFKLFPRDANEYLKTVIRWLLRKDVLKTKSYIRKGHKRSVQEILRKTSLVLPNSKSELECLIRTYSVKRPYCVVPNGVNTGLFFPGAPSPKDSNLVVCAARVEGLKNQLNLIKALNDSPFTLMIIGEPAPNQISYYRKCQETAARNIIFTGRLSQARLADIYKKAKVHVLPSWFETCGLSTLEAAAMGCNVVISDRGYVRDYFGDEAFYCDPSEPASILSSVEAASIASPRTRLQQRVLANYTWQKAAAVTLNAYKKIICN